MIIISPIPAPTVAPTNTSILPPSSSSKHIHTHRMVTSHVRLKIGAIGELYSWIFSYRKRGRLWVALQWLLVMLSFQYLKNNNCTQNLFEDFRYFAIKCEMIWNLLTDADNSITNISRQARAIVATVQTTGVGTLTTLVSTQARHILIRTIVVHWKKLSGVQSELIF